MWETRKGSHSMCSRVVHLVYYCGWTTCCTLKARLKPSRFWYQSSLQKQPCHMENTPGPMLFASSRKSIRWVSAEFLSTSPTALGETSYQIVGLSPRVGFRPTFRWTNRRRAPAPSKSPTRSPIGASFLPIFLGGAESPLLK